MHKYRKCSLISTAVIVGLSSSVYYFKDKLHCLITECCHDNSSDEWINHNPNFSDLGKKIYGQHVALKIIPKLILRHLQNKKPEKPLVISFHGYTGVGKNFMSMLLAEKIYKQYEKTGSSKFIHKFVATHMTDQDPKDVIQTMKQSLELCERSMFIFDEIDKFPEKYLDILLPFLDYSSPWKKSIILFLSNGGGNYINTEVKRLLSLGVPRENITYHDLETTLTNEVIKKGGLKNSDLINRGVIDSFVPFLPLEHEHVEKCIVSYLMKEYNYSEPYKVPGTSFINQVLDETLFKDNKFSIYGCKRIFSKINILIND